VAFKITLMSRNVSIVGNDFLAELKYERLSKNKRIKFVLLFGEKVIDAITLNVLLCRAALMISTMKDFKPNRMKPHSFN
jgi:hypothetical protein